jgi:hypothetical protein
MDVGLVCLMPGPSHTYSAPMHRPSGCIGHFRRELQPREGFVSPEGAAATMHYPASGAAGCTD